MTFSHARITFFWLQNALTIFGLLEVFLGNILYPF